MSVYTTLNIANVRAIVEQLTHCLDSEQLEGLLVALDVAATAAVAEAVKQAGEAGGESGGGLIIPGG